MTSPQQIRDDQAMTQEREAERAAMPLGEFLDEIEKTIPAELLERARIVMWLRKRGAFWERLSLKSEARGPAYAEIAHSQALIAASYQDHADAIEHGDHQREE